jgi:hypothetical protein
MIRVSSNIFPNLMRFCVTTLLQKPEYYILRSKHIFFQGPYYNNNHHYCYDLTNNKRFTVFFYFRFITIRVTCNVHSVGLTYTIFGIINDVFWSASDSLCSKTCLKRNAIVPVFFPVFTGFRFTKGCVLIKQSTKRYDRLGLQWRNNLK